MPIGNEAPGAKIETVESQEVDDLLLIKELDPDALKEKLGSAADTFARLFNEQIKKANKIIVDEMPESSWFSSERSDYIKKQNEVTEQVASDLDVARYVLESSIDVARKRHMENLQGRQLDVEMQASQLALRENVSRLLKELNSAIATIAGESEPRQTAERAVQRAANTSKKKKPMTPAEYRRKVLGTDTNPFNLN